MSFLNTLIGYARKFFVWDYWPYVMAILVLIPLVIIIVVFIRKRRKAKSEKKETKPDVEQEKKPKGMPASSLSKIWKGFLREVPWSVRPSVMVYDHFIVFGEAGAGKSALIDIHTDWQGHARQFYPSYTRDPLLQIYLGSKVLVQEIPPALLNDISENARRALMKLWKPLFKKKDPTVVIVLSGMSLQADEPEYLEHIKQMAQKIRGKINLLSRIRKKTIKVRIALTHMDQFEGFIEFSRFLTLNDIPFKLEFNAKNDLSNISGCLEPYEEHLTRALTSLPADEYLKTMTFLRQAPKLLQYLSVFIKFLKNPDPLSLEPEIASLYLTSHTEGKIPTANPFVPSLTAKELREFDPLFKHRVAAAAIGMAGLVYLSAAFMYEKSIITDRYRDLTSMEASPPARYDQKMHELFPVAHMQKHPLMKLLPDFFPHKNREITRRCIENIRTFYLLPALDRLSMATTTTAYATSGHLVTLSGYEQSNSRKIEEAQDKALYLLGLVYATQENELGKLIQNNLSQWSKITNMPGTLIEDYVYNNESSWHVSVDTKKLSYRQSRSIDEDPRTWMLYFSELIKLAQQPVLTKTDFDALQRENNHFLGVIRQLELFDLSVKIAELLKKDSPLGVNFDIIVKQDAQIRQEPVKNLLMFIRNSSMTYPEVRDDLKLTGLYDNLKIMNAFKGFEGEKDLLFHFLFSGQEFTISAQQWNDLLNRSRITLFLRDFVSHNRRQDGLLFFPSDKEFEDLVMNASNDGRFLFVGHARVDGRFTKDAIEKRVKPVLTELPVFIENLAIPQKEKSYFLNFLLKEVDIYGRRYAQYYRKYYMGFDIKTGSPGALRFALSQMVLPSSPFMDVLLTMRDNTQIDAGNNEYLRSLVMKLNEFEFLKRLMGEQKGSYPELDKYKALLEQMQKDVQEQQPTAGKKDKEETFTVLKNRLTPLGRVGFAIFNGDQDSYVNMVKQWLNSVGIPPQWQDIFLAPVWQAYFLGMTEIETEIGKIWADARQSDIAPLYNKFPFDLTSGEDISAEALKIATHPSGHFWQTFQKTLTPFCFEEDGKWRRRAGPYNMPKLPNNMLQTVNAVTHLSTILWDKEGKERPLEFMIRPGPLPSVLPHEPIAVLSYLQVGESAVFGFNQKPSWRKLKLYWQNMSWASVGVEFITRNKSSKMKRTIEFPTSYWSFYHLLQKTEEYAVTHKQYDSFKRSKTARRFPGNGNSKRAEALRTLTWVINSPAANGESRPMDIIFTIQSDPWALFKLPR